MVGPIHTTNVGIALIGKVNGVENTEGILECSIERAEWEHDLGEIRVV